MEEEEKMHTADIMQHRLIITDEGGSEDAQSKRHESECRNANLL